MCFFLLIVHSTLSGYNTAIAVPGMLRFSKVSLLLIVSFDHAWVPSTPGPQSSTSRVSSLMNCYQAMNAWSFRRFFRIIQHVYLLTVLALRRIYFKQNTPSVPLQPAAVPPPFWKCGVYMHPPTVVQPSPTYLVHPPFGKPEQQ